MFQCDEQHNDGTDYGGCDTWQEAASFQLFCAVTFTTGQQYGEHIKDYDTTGISCSVEADIGGIIVVPYSDGISPRTPGYSSYIGRV